MADEKLLTIPGQGVGPMGERGTITATLRDATANPGPLGLMAFGMTTLLLNIHNAGLYELNTMILAMGIFYGGIAQVIAGIMEWKKNSTFGMTAFLSYGLFWLTLVGLIVFPKWMGVAAPSETAMGYYLLAWGVFTGLMFVATLRINRSLQTVFLSLTILFVLLAFRDWAGGAASADTLFGISGSTWGKIAGWEGIFVALSAVYGSIAQVWNELYGRVVLPLGPYHKR
jgi:succinate-acetate transporter protein